jgi:hypothetical protein
MKLSYRNRHECLNRKEQKKKKKKKKKIGNKLHIKNKDYPLPVLVLKPNHDFG